MDTAETKTVARETGINQWIALISKVAPFSYLSEAELVEVADSFTWFTALGGKTIIQQGDLSDELYIVVSGALGVYVRIADAPERFVARIGPGETVGEMSLISGEPRSASVRCLRDAELLCIARKDWEAFTRRHPDAVLAITKLLVARLRAVQQNPAAKTLVQSLAIIPHDPEVDVQKFAQDLCTALKQHNTAVLISRESATGRSLDWFRELETNYNIVIYLADAEPTPWTQLCLRQCDSLMLVARGEQTPARFEALRYDSTPETIRPMDLALVWKPGVVPVGAAGWLALHQFRMHHHIRTDKGMSDVERVARLMLGKAVGLVLSGGGARGLAHFGVIWALREHGIPIDMVGGTSIGAIVSAMVAQEWSRERMVQCYKDTFTGRSPLTDFTFPSVALLSGRRVAAWLEKWLGTVNIEDLPMSFFCLSANLTAGAAAVHRRGLLTTWVRASISIPGILPPVVDNRHIYVDGGVINNMPVDVMKATGRGKVIAVDIHSGTPFTAGEEIKAKTFLRRAKTSGPTIFQVLWRVATINSAGSYGSAMHQPDILLKPNIGAIGLLDWRGLEGTMTSGYESIIADIERIKSKLYGTPEAAA
jgi:NTE family protein